MGEPRPFILCCRVFQTFSREKTVNIADDPACGTVQYSLACEWSLASKRRGRHSNPPGKRAKRLKLRGVNAQVNVNIHAPQCRRGALLKPLILRDVCPRVR